jgi:hypothetical protein
MPGFRKWLAAGTLQSVESRRPWIDKICVRLRRRPSPATAPITSLHLGAHTIFWSMPSNHELYNAFHPFLANLIRASTYRKTHKVCFCELALHHIQQLMTPIDVENGCPRDMEHLLNSLRAVFTESMLETMNNDLSTLAFAISVEEANA